jgi:hypothetical protein
VLPEHPGAIDFEQLPSSTWRAGWPRWPVPVPAASSRHSNELRHHRAAGPWATSTLQAHPRRGHAREHAALYSRGVGLIATLQRRGASWPARLRARTGIAFDVEKLTGS